MTIQQIANRIYRPINMTCNEFAIELAKQVSEHYVTEALKAASDITHKNGIPRIVDDKQSILDSYPLTNIK